MMESKRFFLEKKNQKTFATGAAVSLVGVTLRLGHRTILSDVSLTLEVGEFCGLLGPNGAGKTTLMRAILGLLAPQSGSITLFGQAPAAARRLVGYMPQSRAALPSLRLSGRDFVAAAASGQRWGLPVPGRAAREDVARVLELVDAADLAGRPLGSLSGGERQRLMLAQALLGQPGLLLLDEPLISLDPHRAHEVVALVRRLQRDLGIAVLFSAHELNPLLGALDRVLYLGGGHAALGRVEEVITGPVLSRLYGTPIDVLHIHGRIFVMAGGHDVERDHHHHE
jgi:zinc/manganese transport system ATP-binding protein